MTKERSRFNRFLVLFAFACAVGSPQSYTLSTIAGSDRLRNGKQASTAPLRRPQGTTQDVQGNIYIVDHDDHRVRKVAPDGTISTIAGNGRRGYTGDGGPATEASLDGPTTVHLDALGNIFVADYGNSVIRKIDAATGIISTLVGNGSFRTSGDEGPARAAGVDPIDFAFDSLGNIYIADNRNHRIRKVTATDRIITTFAGFGLAGYSGDNGPAISSAMNSPMGISVDAENNVYFADAGNNRVRKIDTASRIISPFAGNGTTGTANGGPAIDAPLNGPLSTAVAPNGDVLIASGDTIRRVSKADGIIRAVAGSTSYGFGGDGGSALTAFYGQFNHVSVATNGDILATDFYNYRVRRIRNNVVNTVAGTGISNVGPALSTFLSSPAGVALDGRGGLFIADRLHHQLRSVVSGQVSRILGDGYPLNDLDHLAGPSDVARDSNGNLFIVDTLNHRVLRYSTVGSVSVAAGGQGSGFAGDGQAATGARLAGPEALVVGAGGTIYIADTGNCRVRRVLNGAISTVAGDGTCAYSGDGGPATQAGLSASDVAADNLGNLYIADFVNHRVRKVDLVTGIITTAAGTGTRGYSGDGGPAEAAQLFSPYGLATDVIGDLYITERGNAVVRKIHGGIINTIAGTGDGSFVSSGDSGPATSISFDPSRLAVDLDGSVYVSDDYNDRIRRLAVAVAAQVQISSGQGGAGPPGTTLRVAVRVTDIVGTIVAAIPVQFQVTQGTAQVNPATATTGRDGIASTNVTLGTQQGIVGVRATVAGLPAVTFTLAVTEPAPAINTDGVSGAGLSVPPVRAVSAGAILSAFGNTFGAGPVFRRVGTGDLVDGKVPKNFLGICVEVAGERAGIFGASNTQVNFQGPRIAATGNVSVVIVTGCGTPQEKRSNGVPVAALPATPEFFYFVTNADGRNPVAATDTVTGVGIAAASLFPGSGFAPAKPGQYVTIYATGFGETNPMVTPGEFPSGAAAVTGSVRVSLNGLRIPDQHILYAGVTPFSPGLYQLNLLLPKDTPDGDVTIVVEIGGVPSPPGAYLTVRR